MADDTTAAGGLGTVKRVIDFDTLTGQNGPIPNGYAGLNWFHLGISGDDSGGGAAENHWAQGSGFSLPSGSFDLSKLELESALTNHGRIAIFGFADGKLVQQRTVTVSDDHARTIHLDWHGVDTITVDSANDKCWYLDTIVLRHVVEDAPSAPLHAAVFGADTRHLDDALPLAHAHQDLRHVAQLV